MNPTLDNFQKFLFLGVMLVLAVLGRVNFSGRAVDSNVILRPNIAFGQADSMQNLSTLSAANPLPPPAPISPDALTLSNTSNPNNAGGPARIASARVAGGDVSLPPPVSLAGPGVPATTAPTPPSDQSSLHNTTGLLPAPFWAIGSEPAPTITAESALVADLKTGEIYASTNLGKRWPLASVTKLMTAVVATDGLDLNQVVTFTSEILPDSETTSSKIFKSGDTYSIKDVLRAMLLASSNEAAEALARTYGREQFLAKMNEQAAAWGLDSFHFDDPSGLSLANQGAVTDLRTLVNKIYDSYSGLLTITRTPKMTITEIASGKRQGVANINLFAGETGFVGGKTGYTDEAHGNLVSVFTVGGRPVFVAVLGTDDRFHETEKLINWFKNDFRASR